MICEKCIHKPVCKLRLDTCAEVIDRLNSCCCYIEVDDPETFIYKQEDIENAPVKRVAEVIRCKDCRFATKLDKHCEINTTAYLHCGLLRGEETKYVWHKYKKYYKDYSLVEPYDFCSYGERRADE